MNCSKGGIGYWAWGMGNRERVFDTRQRVFELCESVFELCESVFDTRQRVFEPGQTHLNIDEPESG